MGRPTRNPRIPRALAIAASLSLAVVLGGCGSSAKPRGAPPKRAAPTGRITVVYDPPSNGAARTARKLLRVGGTDGIAAGLTSSFKLPRNVTIHAVNDPVGPSYNPQDSSITLSYPFVQYVAGTLQTNFPKLSANELGRELVAIDGFILMHEVGHMLIDVYSFPVLGKEEDAADAMAAVFLIHNVTHGDEYAFDAARFFDALSARQRKLAPSAYWDMHSLDRQRAYSIACWIAGSGDAAYQRISQLRILPPSRLGTCPSEYQQKVQSWLSLLRPHLRTT